MPKKETIEREREDDEEVLEAEEVDSYDPTPANRSRAAQLRARLRGGQAIPEKDAAWLAAYEDERAAVSDAKRARGASRARKVSYVEEEQEAVGEGDPTAAAMAAGFASREEGRRLDSLITVSMTAMSRAFDMSLRLCDQMAGRNLQLERAHVEMMNAYRENFVGRVEAEADNEVLKRAAELAEGEDKDGLTKLAEQLLPFIMPALAGAGPEDALPAGKKG